MLSRLLLADIRGATKITDDILIFAENTKQHYETLTRVLKQRRSNSITLKLQKNIFWKSDSEYYGFMFSKKGAKLDPEKIQQIQKTPVPENKKNLTKFSETGQLHENILHDYITQISHL